MSIGAFLQIEVVEVDDVQVLTGPVEMATGDSSVLVEKRDSIRLKVNRIRLVMAKEIDTSGGRERDEEESEERKQQQHHGGCRPEEEMRGIFKGESERKRLG